VHAFVNELERPVGAYLYGRRMYEVMVGWETEPTPPARSPVKWDFAVIWQASDKIVYSRTLDTVTTARTRIERDFDPEAVREMKAQAGSDLTVRGPALTAHAFRVGLVIELHLFVVPSLLGWQPGPPQRHPPEPRAAGRTPLHQQCGVSPLPHQDMTIYLQPPPCLHSS